MNHQAEDLITLFNTLFQPSENTILVGGSEEPLYLPADATHAAHRVIFTRDYFASALHEIAHWCIAGPERRLQVDYGYWYFPEGRNREQQQLFEQAEVKPQALECIFSRAARFKFTVSQDNFSLTHEEAERFATLVAKQVDVFLQNGLPERAQRFRDALSAHYQLL